MMTGKRGGTALQRAHMTELMSVRQAAIETGCKGVLCASSGTITVSAAVGYGRVETQEGHFAAWIGRMTEQEQLCKEWGHPFIYPLTWKSECGRCGITYLTYTVEQEGYF